MIFVGESCRQTLYNNFSGKLGENRAKTLRSSRPQNLLAPTPVVLIKLQKY